MINRKRQLRKNETPIEKLMWFELRNRKMGYKFYRQYSVVNYVIDFYCPEKKLAIELDGGQHGKADKKEYDCYRTVYLKSLGINVIRFWDSDVTKNKNKILEKLREVLNTPSSIEEGVGGVLK
jgi:very-short-patch-repair endonuclease